MGKVLLKEYTMRVFSDGSIETREVVNINFNQLINGCSEKIKQAILVILQMKSLKESQDKNEEVNYSDLYNEAVKLVASNLQISVNSVADKLQRGLDKSASEIKDILKDFFTSKNQNLKQVMLDSINKSQQKKQHDTIAVEELFKRLWI